MKEGKCISCGRDFLYDQSAYAEFDEKETFYCGTCLGKLRGWLPKPRLNSKSPSKSTKPIKEKS